MDEIDQRLAATPAFPELQRFKQGRCFKQWTGDDSKALMKVYLPAIHGLMHPDVVKCVSADEHAGSLPSFFAFLAAMSPYVAPNTDYLLFYHIDKSLAIRSLPPLSQKLPKRLGYILLVLSPPFPAVPGRHYVFCLPFTPFHHWSHV
ncbi:hypothetical protein BYT27DRAFT_7264756 [Phlegmacium glaucopus]|nr:hypothetical protein BYT27DRAFT_7264756 [Phlegmacium glaucopus]